MDNPQWVSALINFSPFLIIGAFWIIMTRQIRGGGLGQFRSAKDRRVVSPLDTILIQSERRIAEPKEPVFARILLTGGQTVEGQIIWADGQFIKLQGAMGGPDQVVPKSNMVKIESLQR